MNWKPIPRFSETHEVSDHGLVRTKDRIVRYRDGRVRHYTGEELKQTLLQNGYLTVSLQFAGRREVCYVHDLVASAFLGKRDSSMHDIDHMDGNRLNNQLTNLRYCSRGTNIRAARDRKIELGKARGYTRVGNRFIVRVQRDGMRRFIGSYASEEEAAIAYKESVEEVR